MIWKNVLNITTVISKQGAAQAHKIVADSSPTTVYDVWSSDVKSQYCTDVRYVYGCVLRPLLGTSFRVVALAAILALKGM